MQALAIAQTAMQVIGSITAGNEADKVGTRNANMLNEQAGATLRAAGAREGMSRERSGQALASQRAAMLANGVDPTSGSALVGSEQQMRDADLDALQIRYEGILDANNLKNQANMELWQGKAAKKQSRLTAVSQLIQGGGNYMSGRQAPAPVSTATPKPNPYYKG